MIQNNIHGVLLLDKDSGVTSNRALQQCKRLFNANKAGHTGSLDPLASGVLPICFGDATKFSRFLLDADKTYLVTAKLGIITDTSDAEGVVIATHPVPEFSLDDLHAAINKFLGAGKQIPSMFSALKHRGQPLYKLARKNITVERQARDIYIHTYELLDYKDEQITCKISCSKGTYIRTLIDDLGKLLGCGAHVTSLRRTIAGPFTLEQSTSLASLSDMQDLSSVLLPPESLLINLPKVVLTAEQSLYLRHGRRVQLNHGHNQGIICLMTDENVLLGIGEANNDGNIIPLRLVAST